MIKINNEILNGMFNTILSNIFNATWKKNIPDKSEHKFLSIASLILGI